MAPLATAGALPRERLAPSGKRWLARACCAACLAAAPGACPAAEGASELGTALPAPQAQQAVLDAVRRLAPGTRAHQRYHMAIPFGAPLFPPDSYFARQPQAPAALAAWLALTASARRHDVLITPDTDHFWPAEGRQYRCEFIVHIAPVPGGGARLTLLQTDATEYAGLYFDLLGRTGPGFYMRLRPTAPSPQSAAALRAFLAPALQQHH